VAHSFEDHRGGCIPLDGDRDVPLARRRLREQPAASGVMRCQVTSVPSAARAASPSFGASVRDPVSHGSSGVRGMTDVTVRRGSAMPSASRTISVSGALRPGPVRPARPALP